MAYTWGDFRQMVRRTLLKDATPDEETSEYRWSDDELRDCVWWALEQFARHTAKASATGYTIEDSLSFPLPDNVLDLDPFDTTSVVKLVKSSGEVQYLDPIHYTDAFKESRSVDDYGFYVRGDLLHLTKKPDTGTTLEIEYFAYYDNPANDTDLVSIPRWSTVAVSYLTAAHALSGAGLKSALIRQWGAKPDTGTPEHNPIRQQQKWFMELYEKEIAQHSPQARTNHFREYS